MRVARWVVAAMALFMWGQAAARGDGPVPAGDAPIHVAGRTMAAQSLTRVAPVYPDTARAQHVEGTVKLHAIIGKDGTVSDVTVRSGPDSLQQSAVNAVRQWTYKPYLLHGKAVVVETLILVNFKLNRDPAATDSGLTAWPASVAPVRVSEGVMMAQIVHRVPPVYPSDAQARGLEGNVVLDTLIGEDGTVLQADPVLGPAELRSSAVAAVKQWTFKPYLLNGNDVAVHTTITVDYRLATDERK